MLLSESAFCVLSSSFSQPLSIFDVQFLNAVGDLLDLIPALFEYSARSGQCNVEPGNHGKYQWDMGHCSALIKVSTKNLISSDCVDLQWHESVSESSLYVVCIKRLLSIKVLSCSCHLYLHRILDPVLLVCVQGQGRNPNQTHRD